MLKSYDVNGNLVDKVQIAIQRLKNFEPTDGYFVAFSGGKDSQCIYHLCEMAGVKFDAHYSVTSVDPPNLFVLLSKIIRTYISIFRTTKMGSRSQCGT